MTEGRPTVLLVGLDDALARRVVVQLSPLGVHFRRLASGVVVGEPTWLFDSEVVVVNYQGDRSELAWMAGFEGWSARGARGGAVVVLCPGRRASEIAPVLESGLHRVIPLEELDGRLRDQVASLLDVAPRYRIRAPIRLEPAFTPDLSARMGTTENLSTSGMLVVCPADLPVGAAIRFEISVPFQREPIRGTARVVRMTDPEREGVQGVGARFLSFLASDRTRFDGLLSTQLH